ncbi:Tetracenomycin polyketide synthesis hydroxylase tcmG [Kutzneria albida DSM 43870]|uniref:Tetracenomycin polyketide synthesis hydroxylase tcmG n=1 Tax=Kutzneria albida DSM 43870 TaxID=1449976 RepID=W5W6L9_9PSEU|nr:Tetracenomycin polyketide synthesis hydroxylase tcmG [Kutzneria albida DSM 43870]
MGVKAVGERVSVLVVGAGLAGLASAMFLAQRGVEVLLVERRSGTSLFPRAVGQNQRTMELLGFGGIAEDVPTLTPSLAKFRVRIAASLPGPTFHEEVSETDTTGISLLSPARLGTAGQDKLEPLLRQRAEELGAELRFDTELVSFSQDDDGVTAVLRGHHDGETSQVRADYLVAADGNRGGVREALGVDRHGPGSLGHNVSIIFDADLGALVDPEQATLHVLHNEQANGVFVTVDQTIDRHLYSVGYDPAVGQSPEDFTTERCTELIRLITELPDLEPEIRAVRPWEMAAAVADRFRVGRVLLAGDAAKVTPPSGGFGGNTAVGDAYDLAWKLAAVLGSTAGPELLDTYDAERRPNAVRVVAEALRLVASRGPASAAEDTATEQVSEQQRAVELTLGFRYRSASVLTEDEDPADTEDPYRPTGRPGFRAPHVWLHRNGDKLSTVDLFGRGFVLLAGTEGGFWTGVADDVAARLGVTVRTHTIGDELADADGEFLARYGIGASGASLVRPDGVVAWRTADAPRDPAQVLLGVLTTALAR